MEENNVYIVDESNPLRQSRDNLHYHPQPQDTSTYLVQIPDSRPTEVLPSGYPSRRPRASSIVNTNQLPDTIDENEPLERFVRKNLPNFRKSLTAENIPNLKERTVENENDNIVVTPTSLSSTQADCLPKKISNINQKEEENNLSVNTDIKRSSEQSLCGNTDIPVLAPESSHCNTELLSPNVGKEEQVKNLELPFDEKLSIFPVITKQVSVTQQTPFGNENLGLDRRPSSRVKLMVMVDSHKDEGNVREWKMKDGKWVREDENKKPNKDDGLRENKPKTGKQQKSNIVDDKNKENLNQENGKKITKSIWQNKDYNKSSSRGSENLNFDTNENKENLGDNSKEKLDGAKEVLRKKLGPLIQKNISHDDGHNNENNQVENNRKIKQHTQKEPKEKVKRDNNFTETDKTKNVHKHRTKHSDKSTQGNYTTPNKTTQEAFWMEGGTPYIYTLQTESKPGKQRGDLGQKDKSKDPNSNNTKSRKSSFKTYGRKRYHIEMPEHPEPETPFNVRFHLNHENNVDMTYKGRVKITNYYSDRK